MSTLNGSDDALRYGANQRKALSLASTFSRQDQVPRLPLPTLEGTIEKYLKTIEPYAASPEELATTRKAAEAFLKDPEVHKRHQALKKLEASEISWLEKMWLDIGYHSWRAPLAINSNVVGYLMGKHRIKAEQAFSAAAIIVGALQYHQGLEAGTVPVNMAREKPQCMEQYTRLFNTTRVPGLEQDHLEKTKDSRHIVVICARRLYKIKVLDSEAAKGEIIPLETLRARLSEILVDARDVKGGAAFPVAVLTTSERTTWAKNRNHLLKTNAEQLAAVESACFVVSLDDGVDVTDRDVAVSALVGDGRTKWMDKSFNILCKADGNLSIHIEHSPYDAPTPLDFFMNNALPFAEKKFKELGPNPSFADHKVDAAKWPAAQELEFNLDQESKRAIRQAEKDVDALIADSDVEIVHCMGLGKAVWKQAGLSPDAAVQMAIQLAYRRLHGGSLPVATYETIGMASYRHGRTECCRVVSNDSENFVKTALDGFVRTRSEPDRLRAEAALRKAADAHIKYINEGQRGTGIDRHLLGLRLVAEPGAPTPALFQDPLFARSGTTGGFVLSTSNNSYIPRPFGGLFGSGMPDGYGVCYIPVQDAVVLCVESKRSSPKTNSMRFCEMVNEALMDIATIGGVALPKSML